MKTNLFFQIVTLCLLSTSAFAQVSQTILNPNLRNHPELRLHINQSKSSSANAPRIIFIHGVPGSAETFSDSFENAELRKAGDLITYDRPGFGKSDNNKTFYTIDEQAQAVIEIMNLDHANQNPVILVATSYGAMIAMKVAQLDSRVKSVVSFAAVYDPNSATRTLAQKLTPESYKVLLPTFLLNADNEINNYKNDLTTVTNDIRKVTASIIAVHGLRDLSVDPKNATVLQNLLSKEQVKVKIISYGDHGIASNDPNTVRRTILEAINNLQN